VYPTEKEERGRSCRLTPGRKGTTQAKPSRFEVVGKNWCVEGQLKKKGKHAKTAFKKTDYNSGNTSSRNYAGRRIQEASGTGPESRLGKGSREEEVRFVETGVKAKKL